MSSESSSQAWQYHSRFWMLGSWVSDPSRSRIWTESSCLGFGGCVDVEGRGFVGVVTVVAPLRLMADGNITCLPWGGVGGMMLGDCGRGGLTLPVSRDGDAGISSESESPRLGVSDSEEMTITSSDADSSESASEIMITLSESAIFERNRKRLWKRKEIKIKLRLNETRNQSERKVLKKIKKMLY